MGISITIRGSQPLELLDKVEFENVNNVSVTVSEGTVVHCDGRRPGGIGFLNSGNISIWGLNMSRCGYEWNQLNVSLLFYNCQDINLDSVYVGKSWGFALLFWNTRGKISLENITVYKACQSNPNCSGLGIVFPHCPINNSESYYTLRDINIHECNNNLKELLHVINKDLGSIEYGGGLGIVFKNKDCLTDIKIDNSNISGNSAYWGGGIFIFQRGITTNNSVQVSRTVFYRNSALVSGGGLMVGFVSHDSNIPLTHTNYKFYDCKFIHNKAQYGGGLAVFSSRVTPSTNNVPIHFTKCVWNNNIARFSNDVDLAPSRRIRSSAEYLPIVKFVDVKFLSNEKKCNCYSTETFNSYGSFSSTLFTVHFEGKVLFRHLKNTALHMSSSTIVFLPGSRATFANNSGANGAALAMYGFSVLQLQDNCTLIFTGNKASIFGGGIYFETSDKHDFVSNSKCFIQYSGDLNSTADRNISLIFTNNSAAVAGHSVYALSLYPCYYEWNPSNNLDVVINSSIFNNIGNFTFSPVNRSIATAGIIFTGMNNTNYTSIIPGKCFEMEIKVKDELGHLHEQDFHLVVMDGNITFDRHYLNHNICISGIPSETGVIKVDTMNFRKLSYYLNVTMSPCPPGFYHDKDERVCKCGAETTEHAYFGITRCYMTGFQAVISSNYWAGYVKGELLTAPCPLGFCKIVRTLPLSTSPEEMNKLMCGNHRKGILCGQCQNNFSIYYHSPRFSCGSSKNCSLGIILYLFSEILPLLLIFTVIIFFDIQLTFGVANTLTLFAQLLNSVAINGRGMIAFPPTLNVVADIYRVLYGIFNFDFFDIERLSFCLWKGATVLDMLAIKYVAVIIAVMFVLVLVMGLHYCQCKRVCIVKRKVGNKTSAIHGLTAILIMSYSQCTKVSFELLTTVTLYGEGKRESLHVTFYGGIEYLKQEHFIYAIPASICLVTMVILPPLLLLINPLYLKLFALCGAAEGRLAGIMSKALMTKKLKPILDSFQGTFKDNFRFFAGLYFLYRIAILSASAFASTPLQAHLVMELILILIIGLHAIVWPYRKTLHNISDICILVNIALINSLSLYAYMVESFSEQTSQVITSTISLQASLIFIPLVGIILYFVLQQVVAYVNVHLHLKKVKKSNTDDDTEMDDCIMDREELPYQEFSLSSYKTFYSSPTY